MKKITKKAYAKINLFLDVHSKYDNGYHEVSTVMQTVSLCDDVSILVTKKGISIRCDAEGVPTDNKNIAYRAAELFLEESKIDEGLLIEIKKRIPAEAGLGGGSADAAAALLGLNELFGFPLNTEKLLEIGVRLGADVPFCMVKGCAYAGGIGDKLHELPSMPQCYIVIARGGEGYSTPAAYKMLDEKYSDFTDEKYEKHDAAAIIKALEQKDIDLIAKNMYNIFEKVVLPSRSIASELIKTLTDNGAISSMMSGSGTAVFGIFKDEKKANSAAEKISAEGYFADVAEPIW